MLLLNLRNLYKLLVQRDYPCYSDGVLTKNPNRSRTMVSLWRDLFSHAFPEDTDLQIFETETSRSRSLSKLLAGSEPRGFRAKWYEQLGKSLNADTLSALTFSFYTLFVDQQVDPIPLSRKLTAFISGQCPESNMDASLCKFFEGLDSMDDKETGNSLLQSSYLLAWLSIHALFASCMHQSSLADLRLKEAFVRERILRDIRNTQEREKRPDLLTVTDFITGILPQEKYIGRRDQLLRVVANFKGQTKLAVTGPGGIGKTEFCRQLVQLMNSQGSFCRIAFVPYGTYLVDSLTAAFPETEDLKSEQVFAKVKEILGHNSSTLLIVDNLNRTIADDPDLSFLQEINCAVLVNSRNVLLEGFDRVELEPLTQDESVRLFELISGRHVVPRTEAEKHFFRQTNGHPFLLTVLGHLSFIKFLSVEELEQRLFEQGLSSMKYVENAHVIEIGSLLEKMFILSGLDEKDQKLLRLIAMMPFVAWSPQKLSRYTIDLFDSSDALADELQILADLSWLTRTADGYTMHPVIAERLTMTPVEPDEYPLLWRSLADELSEFRLTEHRRSYVPVLMEMTRHLSGLSHDLAEIIYLLELSVISWRTVRHNDYLLRLHRQWLDSTTHDDADEVSYWIGFGYDCLLFNHSQDLPICVANLASLSRNALIAEKIYFNICNMLDNIISVVPDATGLEDLLSKMEPINPQAPMLASYASMMASWYGRQKKYDEVLSILRKAYDSLEAEHLENEINMAGICHRLSTALADCGRYAEAIPYSGCSLRIMLGKGYAEDSPTILNTRSTGAYMYMMGNQPEEALRIYSECLSIMKDQGMQNNREYYARIHCRFMSMILCQRWEEARTEAPVIHRLLDEGKFIPMNEADMLVYLPILYLHDEKYDTADALLLRFWSKFGEAEGLGIRKKQLLALACKAGRCVVNNKIEEAIDILTQCVDEYLSISPTEDTVQCRLREYLETLMQRNAKA